MGVHVPAEVACSCFVNRGGYAGKTRRHMVLESIFANVMEQFLQSGNLHHTGSAKCVQRIVGETAASGITPDFPRGVVRREPRKTHGAGLYLAHAGSKCIVL